jgi:hypothetical protein
MANETGNASQTDGSTVTPQSTPNASPQGPAPASGTPSPRAPSTAGPQAPGGTAATGPIQPQATAKNTNPPPPLATAPAEAIQQNVPAGQTEIPPTNNSPVGDAELAAKHALNTLKDAGEKVLAQVTFGRHFERDEHGEIRYTRGQVFETTKARLVTFAGKLIKAPDGAKVSEGERVSFNPPVAPQPMVAVPQSSVNPNAPGVPLRQQPGQTR